MVDLKELERRLDEALAKETRDSLNSWLNRQRIDEFENIPLRPCTGEVVSYSYSFVEKYLIEYGTNYYPPPLPKQKNKKTKKDSVINKESFFLL